MYHDQFYQNYKTSLGDFSRCIKPIIDASYERYFVQPNSSPDIFNLEEFCIFERKMVELHRNFLIQRNKGEKIDYTPLNEFIANTKRELNNIERL